MITLLFIKFKFNIIKLSNSIEINEAIETIIKFGEEKIPLRLLIGNEDENDTLEIMLGLTFLENVKPYQITSYGLKITTSPFISTKIKIFVRDIIFIKINFRI